MTEQTHITVTEDNGIRIVRFADRKILEECTISEIGDELARLVESVEGIKLLLSFENVDHLSSAALGMLITLNQKVGERNGRLILADIQANIFQVFRITRLNKLFEICESAKVAMSKF